MSLFAFFKLGCKKIKIKILDVLFPPACALCKTALQSQQSVELCGNCWKNLRFITGPYCKICGLPLEYGDSGQTCLGCIKNKSCFDCARAAIVYGGTGKSLILRFKHNDETRLLKTLSNWLLRAISELPLKNGEAVVLAPIPLHWTRLVVRKYNQSALLSKGISMLTGTPCVFNLLKRIRMTKSQGRFGLNQRRLNVKGAFRLKTKYQNSLYGKTVLLIDDVFTTGSTINECAKVLKLAGAHKVYAVTVAKTDHPQTA
ncbi:MAG: ComF family protein [Holosporales bacterium]|nr:ComF family protein [Holosporales bacterium]